LLEDDEDEVTSVISMEEKEEIELDMTVYGTLVAHINGFAAINSFSEVQQLAFFSSSPYRSLLVTPLAFVFVFGMFQALDYYRETKALEDGFKDEREKLWDSESEECENDVAGL
jgi:hypothetical protein